MTAATRGRTTLVKIGRGAQGRRRFLSRIGEAADEKGRAGRAVRNEE